MKHKKKKIFIAVALTLIIATAAFLFFACRSHESGYTPPPDDVHTVTAPPPTDGTTPEDHDGMENLAYMAGRLAAREYYHSENNGIVDTIAKQTVVGSKDYYKGILITESISTSAFVNVAEQKFFGDGKVVVRGPVSGKNDWDGINTEWSDDEPVAVYDEKQYEQAYGLWASEFSDYVLNEGTVLDVSELNVLGDGLYSQTFTLDPAGATYYYKHQMMTMGGLSDYPLFSSVSITFTFDDTWAVQRADIVEEYEVYAFFMTVACKATSSIVYSYDESDVDVTAYDAYFSKYADAAVTGGGDKELGVTDYLQQGFAEYLAEPSAFALTLDIGGSRVDGLVMLDLTDGINVRAQIGGIYVNVTDENVYVSYKDFCGCIPLSYITEKLGLGGVLDLDGILDVLGAGTIEKNGEDVTINCSLSLGGPNIPLVFAFTENENGVKLNNISVALETDVVDIAATLAPAKGENVPEQDVSSATDMRPFVDNILGIVDEKSFEISISYEDAENGISLYGDIYVNAADFGAEGDVVLTCGNISVPVRLVYDGQKVYLKVYNVGVCAATNEISDALNEILAYLEVDLPDAASADISGIISSVVSNYDTLIKSLVLNEDGLSLVLDGDALLSCINAGTASIGDVSAYYDVKANAFTVNALGANVTLKGANAVSVTAPEDGAEYVELALLEKFVAPVKAIADSRDVAFSLDFAAMVRNVKLNGNIVGEIRFADGIEVYLKITVSGKTIEIYYADANVYFAFAEHVFRISESELKSFAERVSALTEELGLTAETEALLSAEGLDIAALLESIRVSGAESDGKAILRVFADLGAVGLTEIAARFETDGEKLYASLDEPFVFGGLSLDSMNASIYAADGEYSFDTSAAVGAMPYLDGICELLENRSIDIEINYVSAALGLNVSGNVYVNAKDVSAQGALTVKFGDISVPVTFVYADGTVYLKAYNVGVKTDTDYLVYALEQLFAFTGTELPTDVAVSVGDIINSLLGADLSSLITEFTVNEEKAVIGIDGDALKELVGFDVGDVSFEYRPGVNVFRLAVLGADITLTNVPPRVVTAPEDGAEYVELALLEKFVAPVKAIADSRDVAFSLAFDTALLGLDMNVTLEGEAIFADKLTSLYIKAHVYSDGYADDTVELLYGDGYLTVVYLGKAMRIDAEYISDLVEAIGGMNAGTDGPAALMLFGDGGIDIDALLKTLTFAARDEDGRTVADVFVDLGIVDPSLPAIGLQLTSDGETISVHSEKTELFGLKINGIDAVVKAGNGDMSCDLTGVTYCGNLVDFVLGSYIGLTGAPYVMADVSYRSELIDADVSGLFGFTPGEGTALDIDFDIRAEIHTYAYDDTGAKVEDGSHYLEMTVVGEKAYITYSLYAYGADGALNVTLPVSQLFEIGSMVLPLMNIGESAGYFDLVTNLLSTDYTYFSTGIFDAVQFADILGLFDGVSLGGGSENTAEVTLGKNENGEKTLNVTGVAAGEGTLDVGITAKTAGEIAADTGRAYIDISSISYLLGDLLHAYEYTKTGYALSGDITMKVFNIEVDLKVHIDLTVGVDESGMPYLNLRLTADQYENYLVWGIFGTKCIIDGNTVTDITYKDGNIYMTRVRTSKWNGKEWAGIGGKFESITPEYQYRRMTLSEFGADAMNQMFFAIGLSDGAKNYISKKVSETEPANNGSDVGNMVSGYSFDGNVYNLKLNMGAIADNNSLGELDLNITRQKLEGRDYYDLVRLSGSIKLVSIVTATFDITHDSVGGYVDLSVIDKNIALVNANV